MVTVAEERDSTPGRQAYKVSNKTAA